MTMPAALRKAANLLDAPPPLLGFLKPPAETVRWRPALPTAPRSPWPATAAEAVLPHGIYQQQRSLWCWAALIRTLMSSGNPAPLEQCSIVENHWRALGDLPAGVSCCPPSDFSTIDDCNRTALLPDALEHTGLPRLSARSCSSEDLWPDLEAALANGPVPCLLRAGSDAHYCLLGPRTVALLGGGYWVELLDPMDPSRCSIQVESLCFEPCDEPILMVEQYYLVD